MSLIVPHRTSIQGHTTIRHLVRASCSCGWWALAANEANARAAADQHKFEEDPFPDAEELLDPLNPPEHLK